MKIGCMWIDALCIDQGSHKEKGHQVGMMGKVYSGAEKVIVWLGLSNADSDSALDMIQDIQALSEIKRLNSPQSFPESDTYAECSPTKRIYRRCWYEKHGSAYFDDELRWPESENPRMKAVLSLLTRPYWRRIWIIQEIHPARRLSFHCGSRSISDLALNGFRCFVDSLPNSVLGWLQGLESEQILIGLNGTFALRLLGIKGEESESRRLKTWLHECIRLECICSEPRDFVYALLGLSEDCQNGELVPDYEKDLIDVYYDAKAVCSRNQTMTHVSEEWMAFHLMVAFGL